MNVGVIGAGTMGHGIAQVTAMAGHEVVVRDVKEQYVEAGLDAVESNLSDGVERGKVTADKRQATLANLSGTTDMAVATSEADLAVEAVPEDLDIKRETFAAVEATAPEACVIASNTSSLSVTEIAAELADPTRALGLHFFNPVHLMELVEIVRGEQTSNVTHSVAEQFVDSIEKTSVTVRDAPGFASSRLGVALGVEAVRMVESGVAGIEDVDTAMELGYNHPMGPLELTDVVGLDVRLDILTYLREELGERFKPPQLLKRKVRAGALGKKTGEGFYVWEDGEPVGPSRSEGGR